MVVELSEIERRVKYYQKCYFLANAEKKKENL
ncbi:unnamed protein product [Nezara viridula]|uniref:Uncharacterized protein n=1 Tax=Nezara viridula TaxID=85310 RepID=A0A9P0HB26_NEZVI|nr:unnamed protein product [Nezara viridula]